MRWEHETDICNGRVQATPSGGKPYRLGGGGGVISTRGGTKNAHEGQKDGRTYFLAGA